MHSSECPATWWLKATQATGFPSGFGRGNPSRLRVWIDSGWITQNMLIMFWKIQMTYRCRLLHFAYFLHVLKPEAMMNFKALTYILWQADMNSELTFRDFILNNGQKGVCIFRYFSRFIVFSLKGTFNFWISCIGLCLLKSLNKVTMDLV